MLSYLLESSCCWVLLYGFYGLFLRQEKRFGYNRAYLLLALLLGLLAPLLSLENQVATVLLAPVDLSAIAAPTLENFVQATPAVIYWNWLPVLYGLGLLFFGGRFCWGLHRIQAIYKKSQVAKKDHYQLVTMPEAYPPFSFVHCLFVPAHLNPSSTAYHCIVTHEAAHIQQGHSWDILLVELLQIVFWFNPILILYKMALRDQHEYLADQAVLEHTSVTQYGHLLLDQSVSTLLPLVHPFFHSPLKKRIIMMTTSAKSAAWNKYALGLLACFFAFWMVACQKSNNNPEAVAMPDEFPYLASCENADKEEQKRCSNQELLQLVYGEVNYPKSAKEAGAEGMAVIDFVIQEDGSIGDMEILKSTDNAALDAEALRVLQALKAKGNIWKPGILNGEEVAVSYKLPLRFKLQ